MFFHIQTGFRCNAAPIQRAGLGVITRAFTRLGEVEAVKVHDLVPGRDKVTHKLFLVVVLGIDFGKSTQLRVETKYQIHAGAGPLQLARLGVAAFEGITLL